MKNRNKKLIFFIIILITASVLFYLKNYKNDKIFKQFAVKNTEKITKIIIKDSLNNVITLEKSDIWLLNQKFEVRRQSIDLLLQTIENLQIQAPVPKNLISDVSKKLYKNKKTISLFAGKKMIKKWYCGQYSQTFNGTFMSSSDDVKPYIVNLPGIENNLNNIFSTNELQWRTKSIYKYTANQISEISVKYTNKPQESFNLKLIKNNAELTEIYNNKSYKNVNSNAVSQYISYFENIEFDLIFTNISKKSRDSILIQKPIHEITVTLKSGIKNTIKTYNRMLNDQKSKKQDLNYLNASINDDKDIVIIKYYNLDLLFKNLDYFLKK